MDKNQVRVDTITKLRRIKYISEIAEHKITSRELGSYLSFLFTRLAELLYEGLEIVPGFVLGLSL